MFFSLNTLNGVGKLDIENISNRDNFFPFVFDCIEK